METKDTKEGAQAAVVIYANLWEAIEGLSDERLGALLRCLMGKVKGVEYECADETVNVAASMIASVNERARQAKLEKQRRNREYYVRKRMVSPSDFSDNSDAENAEKSEAEAVGEGSFSQPSCENKASGTRKKTKATYVFDPSAPPSWLPSDFVSAWEKWISYKRSIRNSYASEATARSGFKRIYELSGGDATIALRCVEYSIEQGYKGVFRPKNDYYGVQQNNGTTTGSRLPTPELLAKQVGGLRWD